MPPRADRTAGFSLIEVLVAFVILTLVITMCLQVYSSSARTESAARWSEAAHTLLRDRLASAETLRLQPGQHIEGETADGLRWSLAVSAPGAGSNLDSGHSLVWINAQVSDPAGRIWSVATARWRGERSSEDAS